MIEDPLQSVKTLQQEEWEVLDSIYPDCVASDISTGILKLEVPVEFGEVKQVALVDGNNDGISDTSSESSGALLLSTLPSILLDIALPQTYPLSTPPQIMSLHATQSWLSLPGELVKLLLEMWQAGDGVLYNWVEFIRNASFLEPLGLLSPVGVITIHHPAPHLLAPLLSSHEKALQLSAFTQNTYTCAVCMESLKGSRCLRLECSHVFCRSCLEDFWKLCIQEGDVGRVCCPDPECVKSGKEANEEEVRRVVDSEELKRWKWLREKRAIEKDPTIVHCPVAFCQTPVPRQVEDEDSGWARLRTCPSCNYSFCSFCKRTWHGPITSCPISVTETLVLEYVGLPGDSPRRRALERNFGRANIARLVAQYEEEQANKKYFKEETMECPGCHVHVQKSLGCNHMTCAKCHMHFCYRCGQQLDRANPYAHFSTPGKACYYKLFDFQPVGGEEWQPIEGFAFV